jgi:glucose-6-phosphate isomerase
MAMDLDLSLGRHRKAFDSALAEASSKSYVGRIWSRDATLWKSDEPHRKIIESALGWLDVARPMKANVSGIQQFTNTIRRNGFTDACLLGMGGSSLCPEVCARTFGAREGYLHLTVLDTTDPDTVLAAEGRLNPERTLFIVSSKSGGTIESVSLQKYFFDKLRTLKGSRAGENFAAVTDPGTSLEKLASDLGFCRVFLNPKNIGGRYSALSYFGLVPMSLIGVDLEAILDRAIEVSAQCGQTNPGDNPGLRLGVALGVLARAGLDKATFVLAPEIAAFGAWVEQLIAESTGKEGVGILPVDGEALGAPEVYGSDRVFIQLRVAGRSEPAVDARLKALENAGHPVVRRDLADTLALGGEFFIWEFATAVAGAVLGINPFDQPNVQESKGNTRRLIHEAPAPEEEPQSPAALLRSVKRGDYVALLAYVERCPANDAVLEIARVVIRDRLRCATTVGYGPRYLHSTGQLHKGGANNGVFILLTGNGATDLAIPGEAYSLGRLKRAQASGDLQALLHHRRRAGSWGQTPASLALSIIYAILELEKGA